MARDLEALQGTWHLTAADVDGTPVPAAARVGASIVITRKTFRSVGMGAPYEGTLEIDETSKPKTLDMEITVGHAAGTRHTGVYRLARGQLTLCMALSGDQRPRKFAAGSGLVLETFERGSITTVAKSRGKSTVAKPAASRQSAGADRQATTGAPTAIEGEWEMVSGVFNGAAMADSMVKWCTRVSLGDVTTVLAGPKVMLKARFTLNDSTAPAQIDYVVLEGSDKGKTQAGIAEWGGGADTLRINMAPPGKPRPADFTSKAGDKRSMTAWRRRR